MSKKNKKNEFIYFHKKPTTRREFLASGLVPFTASFFLPPILDVLARNGVAQAAETLNKCGGGGLHPYAPFVNVNLAGGASISGNVLPKLPDGSRLPNYNQLGYGGNSGQNIVAEKPFGAKGPEFNAGNAGSAGSGLLQGIRSVASPTTLANTTVVSFCIQSQDDSRSNAYDMSGLLAKAGITGSFLPGLGENRNQKAIIEPPAPLNVRRVDDVRAAIGVAGRLNALNDFQKDKLFKTIRNLSSVQRKRIARFAGGEVLSQLVECATGKNVDLVSANGLDIDPSQNASFANVWNNLGSAREEQFATVVYNVLKKNAGVGNLTMGGYDYHGNNRNTTDGRDIEAGTVLGQVLESAAVLGQPIVVSLTTDGSVSSRDGTNFSSDSGNRGMALMFFYSPTGRPEQINSQVGAFTKGQVVDTTFVMSRPESGTASMFAHYLAFNGRLGEASSIVGRQVSPEILKEENVLITNVKKF
ncbi:MAG: hypothetical protein D6797_09050 [Bdellovibrio sp.]|nr:MAG: hypothetical protein D6797_09050 [Bdellovibrio sp.]